MAQFQTLSNRATVSFPAGAPDGAWHLGSTTETVSAGQRYTFTALLGQDANMDNASVEYITRDVASCLAVDGGDLSPTPAGAVGGLPNGPSGPISPTGDPAEPDIPDGRGDPGGSGDPGAPGDPDKLDLPEARQVFLKKACEAPMADVQNGQPGMAWRCEVTVAAIPVPFAGSFGFLEDASGVSGASGAEIVSVNASPGWSRTPAPGSGQAQTACSINGADFDPSGQKVLRFELFADMSNVPEQPVTWENCVSGASDPAANSREASDCVTASWSPPPPSEPLLDIFKTCDAPVAAGSTGWDVACYHHRRRSAAGPVERRRGYSSHHHRSG